MSAPARDAYLQAQVYSATPQKLHLMLIDGAIGSLQRVSENWEEPESLVYGDEFARAQRVTGEMLAAICEARHALSTSLVPLYTFLFTTVTTAQLCRDRKKLNEALALLTTERETWSAVCTKFGSTRDLAASPETIAALAAIAQLPAALPNANSSEGISLEA